MDNSYVLPLGSSAAVMFGAAATTFAVIPPQMDRIQIDWDEVKRVVDRGLAPGDTVGALALALWLVKNGKDVPLA